MAPIRRYLRITKYSVLECRIYLDNPALAQTWLLNPRDPILPKVIESVRPLVLPKLREERERSRSKKASKKRGIKDVVTEADFEVSIFLTETSTRHSLLYKHKHFRDTKQTKLTSNSTKLTGASREAPIDVEAAADSAPVPTAAVLREEADDDVVLLSNIPTIEQVETATTVANKNQTPPSASIESTTNNPRRSKRRRGSAPVYNQDESGHHNNALMRQDTAEEGDGLFVSSDDGGGRREGSSAADETTPPLAKRRKDGASAADQDDLPGADAADDTKKKLAMDISYEGFSIYGRVLCLVVKRREGTNNKGKGVVAAASTLAPAGGRQGGNKQPGGAPGGQAVMENWITSTQMPAADGLPLDAS